MNIRSGRKHYSVRMLIIFIGILLINMAHAERCLYVSSYNKGNEWNDGIETGIESVLKQRCELDKVYMDTDKDSSIEYAQHMGKITAEYIHSSRPDIVIACDDSASKYLVVPYLKNSNIPVVFCGVNWNVDDYAYPYANVTGIIEVAPIMPLLTEIESIIRNPSKAVFLSSDVSTEHKDYSQYRNRYASNGILVEGMFAKSFAMWKKYFLEAQNSNVDFIILGNNSGINDWNVNDAMQFIQQNARKLSVTNYDWMMPYAMLGMAKLPQEQGVWAAKVAISILDGFPIKDIPIVVNRQREFYINSFLFSRTHMPIPKELARKAVSLDYQ